MKAYGILTSVAHGFLHPFFLSRNDSLLAIKVGVSGFILRVDEN